MMTESTQCIASALRNSILNLGIIPKVVYQDNGRAFKSRFFQNNDFDENIFNGVYANLNIHSVFAKPYNAKASWSLCLVTFQSKTQTSRIKNPPILFGISPVAEIPSTICVSVRYNSFTNLV